MVFPKLELVFTLTIGEGSTEGEIAVFEMLEAGVGDCASDFLNKADQLFGRR